MSSKITLKCVKYVWTNDAVSSRASNSRTLKRAGTKGRQEVAMMAESLLVGNSSKRGAKAISRATRDTRPAGNDAGTLRWYTTLDDHLHWLESGETVAHKGERLVPRGPWRSVRGTGE